MGSVRLVRKTPWEQHHSSEAWEAMWESRGHEQSSTQSSPVPLVTAFFPDYQLSLIGEQETQVIEISVSKRAVLGWGDGSMVKSTDNGCSSRGPGF